MDQLAVRQVRQLPLGERVAHQLRVLIVTGQLESGTHLVEGALADRFDVSRGPIRDALRLLESEGLVESRRRGVYVTGLGEDDVDELFTLRESLETLALTRAIERAGKHDIDVLNSLVTAMAEAADEGDPAVFAQADLEFHSAFYALAGHRRLAAVWEQYRPVFAVILDVTNTQDRDLHPAAEAHADLLHAIRSGDVAQATSLLSSHLLGAGNRLQAALRQVART
ncbi:GntR family transcriptional regulator [Saccharopolyspora sp. WRP15-2]|uniref:GntR family transcriptional regulator n=1 Tax=Saccharopolyspora oryzae TaxID=2997343 RepID=A0ABT4UVZ8_9PSEU|nr:GntR family transcriptional regulator [Saccharopolyspora oryzae]MDA3625728.1 GntR family transcriptional regulator [Saccharopolyspora oryzae]